MIDIMTEYEWLINLICVSIFTGGMFLDVQTVKGSALVSGAVVASYFVLVLNVVLNGLVKGF